LEILSGKLAYLIPSCQWKMQIRTISGTSAQTRGTPVGDLMGHRMHIRTQAGRTSVGRLKRVLLIGGVHRVLSVE